MLRFDDKPGLDQIERDSANHGRSAADLRSLLVEGETHEQRLRIARAAAVALASPFAALRWLDAWYLRPRPATADELARLAQLRRAACDAIDEARCRLPS